MQQDFVKQKLKKKNLNKVPLWHSQTRNFLYVPIRAYRAKVRKLWKIAHPYGPAINNGWRQEARDLCCMRPCVSPSALIFSRNLDRAMPFYCNVRAM